MINNSIVPIVQNPLTYETPNNSSAESISLNIHQGLAATVLDRMIAERARSLAAKQAADKRKSKGDLIQQDLKEA